MKLENGLNKDNLGDEKCKENGLNKDNPRDEKGGKKRGSNEGRERKRHSIAKPPQKSLRTVLLDTGCIWTEL